MPNTFRVCVYHSWYWMGNYVCFSMLASWRAMPSLNHSLMCARTHHGSVPERIPAISMPGAIVVSDKLGRSGLKFSLH